jgi:sugar/nucleoside kinase (ribokinase family)
VNSSVNAQRALGTLDGTFERIKITKLDPRHEMSYDLIALGETMLALAAPAGASLRDAPHLVVDHAGAESNTCVGLARLGFRVAWMSRLGSDAAGDRIAGTLAERESTCAGCAAIHIVRPD